MDRLTRACHFPPLQNNLHTCGFDNLWVLVMLVVLGILLVLILLGIIKGLLGYFCCAPVGMWGLGVLIELPRPLDQYQEPELANTPVQYDGEGWPIHPDTGERTVRAITKKTEFCLNIVFFLTYPVAMILRLCSLCCPYEVDGEDCQCYHKVNTIVFAECPIGKIKEKNKGPTADVYKDGDKEEDKDTTYVINQMRQSQESLKNGSYY